MRLKLHFASVIAIVVVAATVFTGRAHASFTEPLEVQLARDLIKDNGRSIVYFALPTYKYVSAGYNEYRHLSDGFELTFTFECTSFWRTNTTRMAFYFDPAGQFDYCKAIRSTTHYTPFTGAVGKKELKKLRAFLSDHPVVRDSRKLLHECESANAKQMCELYLKVEQARKNAQQSPNRSSAKKTPLDAVFLQVAPVPKRPMIFERSGQNRAVVLIHGYRPEFDRFLLSRAVPQDWQEPDSFMVKILARDADVYAFAYGQNVSVREVAEAPELAAGIARLKEMGYRDLVLVGYSAGGLVCRHYVHAHNDSGVTKVVQVCSPNAGSFLARFGVLVPATQQPFVDSLTAASRNACSLANVPDNIEFICVVGDAFMKTDSLLSCRTQWSPDLQEQGIPALRLHFTHLAITQNPESISAIARAIREPAPRWERTRMLMERQVILKE